MKKLNLNKIFLLDGLNDTDKDTIIKKFNNYKSFIKGDIIYSPTTFFNAIGYIVKGTAVAVTNNDDGFFMNTFSQGMCFGAAALFGGGEKYVSTIISTSNTDVLFINENQLTELFKSYPRIYENYIVFLSNKVRFLNEKLSLLSCHSAEDTVFKYLCSITDSRGFAKIPKNMTLLSKILGIGRATLYRCLESLKSEGYIIKENNNIKVIKNEENS